jgi:hypothetical protein
MHGLCTKLGYYAIRAKSRPAGSSATGWFNAASPTCSLGFFSPACATAGPPFNISQLRCLRLVPADAGTLLAIFSFKNMEHRGVSYSLIEGPPGVWRWSVSIGHPPMLRIGEAGSEHQADEQVRSIIDLALARKKVLKFEGNPDDKG